MHLSLFGTTEPLKNFYERGLKYFEESTRVYDKIALPSDLILLESPTCPPGPLARNSSFCGGVGKGREKEEVEKKEVLAFP